MKTYDYNKNNRKFAKELRKNMTDEERKLWYKFLRKLNTAFRRQMPIGNYIADFYCAECHLVIELDGGQHFEDDALEYDKVRDLYFNSLGIQVLRLTNRDINFNFDGVCSMILKIIDDNTI